MHGKTNNKINMTSKLLLFVYVLVLTVSCAESKHEKKSSHVVIKLATATNMASANTKEFSFISKPFRTSDLSFRVGGPITNLDVYVGNYYKQGELIAEIDPRDFHVRKEQAEATYQQAKAEYKRIKVLYEKNNISASAFEKTNADYIRAKTAYETTNNELNDTRLTAPFNGYIGERFIEKHQDVKATQAIVSFINIERLKIEFYVTQDIAFDARENLDSVQISFDAMPNVLHSAKIAEVSKSPARNNLSYLVTAILPNRDGRFLAGMSGKVFFDVKNLDATPISIPQSGLCHNQTDGDFVWMVDTAGKTVSKRAVKMGTILSDGRVSVVSGLRENDLIATSGLRFLSNGTKIEIEQN